MNKGCDGKVNIDGAVDLSLVCMAAGIIMFKQIMKVNFSGQSILILFQQFDC
jgi:hypothetical protein